MEDPESCQCQMAAAAEEMAEHVVVAVSVVGEEERAAEETCTRTAGAIRYGLLAVSAGRQDRGTHGCTLVGVGVAAVKAAKAGVG